MEEILLLACYLLLIAFLQFIALHPLKKLGISYAILLTLVPGFILLTQGITYYIHTLFPLDLKNNYAFTFTIALLLEYFFLSLIVNNVIKKNLALEYNSRCSLPKLTELIFLFLTSTLLFSIYLFLNRVDDIIKFSGDGVRLVQVVENLVLFDQRFFYFTYSSGEEGLPIIGSYYPWAGFIISAIALQNLSVASVTALVVPIIFFASFGYLFTVYLLIKLLKIPNTYHMFIYIFFANIFPLGLLYSNNFANLLGVISAIVIINVFLIIKPLLSLRNIFFFISISFFTLLSVYPSALFTIIILSISILIIFYPDYLMARGHRLINTKIRIYPAITFVLIVFVTAGLVFSKVLSESSLFDAVRYALINFINTPPTYFSLSEFLESRSVINSVITFVLKNIITLSYWQYSIPVLLIIIFIVIYSFVKFNKRLIYIIPLFIYLILILASSLSGINNWVNFISKISIPFYQSPLRITHLGVLIYFLYLGKFLKDLSFYNFKIKKFKL